MVMLVVLVPMVAEGTMVLSPMVSVLKLVIALSALVGLVIALVGGSVVGDSVVGGSVVGDSVGVSSLNCISAILGAHSALGFLLNVISMK